MIIYGMLGVLLAIVLIEVIRGGGKNKKLAVLVAFTAIAAQLFISKVSVVYLFSAAVSVFAVFVFARIKAENGVLPVSIGTVAFVIFCAAVYVLTDRMVHEGTLYGDIAKTYISSVFTLRRFSATPVVGVSTAHFILINAVLQYLFIIKKQGPQDNILLSLGVPFFTAGMSLLLLGVLYTRKWGSVNIVEREEYLTSFNEYMLVLVTMMLAITIYQLVQLLLNRQKGIQS